MVKKNEISTVTDARNALSQAGKRLEKALGGEEKGLALRAVKLADKCLKFHEKELRMFMNPKTRDKSLLNGPKDVNEIFRGSRDVLNLFAGILKKTEEAERDLERDELHRRTVAVLEGALAPPMPLPIVIDPENDSSN